MFYQVCSIAHDKYMPQYSKIEKEEGERGSQGSQYSLATLPIQSELGHTWLHEDEVMPEDKV